MKLSQIRTIKKNIENEIKNDSNKLQLLSAMQSITKSEIVIFVIGMIKRRIVWDLITKEFY